MKQDNVSKEFAGLVGDEWHEWIVPPQKDISSRFECSCGLVGYDGRDAENHITVSNHVYTIELIKARIQARGDWDKFKVWLWNNTAPDMTYAPFGNMIERMHGIVLAIAETLTTPALLMQAYIAYRRAIK